MKFHETQKMNILKTSNYSALSRELFWFSFAPRSISSTFFVCQCFCLFLASLLGGLWLQFGRILEQFWMDFLYFLMRFSNLFFMTLVAGCCFAGWLKAGGESRSEKNFPSVTLTRNSKFHVLISGSAFKF